MGCMQHEKTKLDKTNRPMKTRLQKRDSMCTEQLQKEQVASKYNSVNPQKQEKFIQKTQATQIIQYNLKQRSQLNDFQHTRPIQQGRFSLPNSNNQRLNCEVNKRPSSLRLEQIIQLPQENSKKRLSFGNKN